jgi:ATP-dependent exoDNAse (exonuclease V) beta subunit
MTLPLLTLIPAGAGSGKTYTIQQQLGAWVAENKVAPERIVAVTFTEAAAAELRERIGATLLAMGRVDEALRLDQAYISTIHGFGLRLLTEFAFEAGTSPQPRLLNDDEKNALIRLALARTDKTDAITADLPAYGYTYDHNLGKSAEDVFRDDLLRIVELLRALGCQSDTDAHAVHADEWIAERYGPTGAGEGLSAALRHSVEVLLQAFPESLARECGNSNAALDDLQNDFRNLHRALDGSALETDWPLWQGLRELRRSNRRTALPDGYDALAEAVVAAADELPQHPGPLAHARSHIAALLAAGQDVLDHYAEAKREAGLVDYTDMIAMAGQLLQERPDVLETLTNRVECLVVDEFQDTNPLQFALLWQLKEAGIPTVVVGDLKQAIMGFQGADPRLFAALERQNREAATPLTRNWRSQPPLMAFVNAVGRGLFGEDYVALEPQSKESELTPLEVVSFQSRAKKEQHAVRAVAVGKRLQALLDDPDQRIIDRRTKTLRRLRGSDLAVLCPTNTMLATYADVLRAQGMRVRLQADGWFSTRPVQIAWHALAYLANPADRHAALYLAVTELGSLDLEQALGQLMDAGRIEEPLLVKLNALADGVAERTVYALVADALAALDLFGVVARWPDGEQARANLLRLLAEAGEFMDANREALANGGFHGAGVQTFLAWLGAKVEDNDEQPDPRVLDEDAIQLATWHKSKGLEWPVVAVCGLDRVVKARLPNVELGYRSFDDLSRLLEYARIEYAPRFAAAETSDRFLAELQAAAKTEARRLLYVAVTRARDKVVLEWPGFLVGKDSTTYWSILKEDCKLSLAKDAIKVGSADFPCAVLKGQATLPEDLDLAGVAEDSQLPVTGRRAVRSGAVPDALTPDSRTPSGMDTEATAGDVTPVQVACYGEGLGVDIKLPATSLGTFLHRCFEVLGARPDLSERLPLITAVEVEPRVVMEIGSAVARFEAWLRDHVHAQSVLREWPLLALDAQGTVVSGTADLIVNTAAGVWVIDHKSDQTEDPVQTFRGYQAQLESYAMALAGEGRTVLGIAINWIRRGEVVLKPVEVRSRDSKNSSGDWRRGPIEVNEPKRGKRHDRAQQ